jgi:subtilase family serine protease
MKKFAIVSASLLMFGCAGGEDILGSDTAASKGGKGPHARVCSDAAPGEARCHSHVIVDSTGQAQQFTTPSGYGPSDLRSAYNISFDPNVPTDPNKPVITIAIVDAYGYSTAESDLAVYRSQYGLGACTTANGCFKKVNQLGQQSHYPRANTGWSQETALDLDMASAMCPSCKILLVEANTASYTDLGAAVNTAVALGAHVVSNSYGGGESGTATYESAYNHPGVAITVSSGDSGYGVQFPASSPHVTAVGGTSLSRDPNSPRGFSESAWSGAGSGCSTVYAQPSWQAGVVSTDCTQRAVADVSAVADPNTGVAVYGPNGRRGSSWLVFGGTSVAAPLVGGVYAANGGAVNYGSNPYTANDPNAPAALNDVTSGSNGSCGGSDLCTAGAGWDGPTGLGTPNGTTAF